MITWAWRYCQGDRVQDTKRTAVSARIMRSLIVSLLLIASSVLAADRPNVLFIAIDDLNHWVGYLGRNKQAITPNIDKLAARGVSFTRSYCAAPVCNPSRAALMSGLRPGQTGVYDNNHDWRKAIRTIAGRCRLS